MGMDWTTVAMPEGIKQKDWEKFTGLMTKRDSGTPLDEYESNALENYMANKKYSQFFSKEQLSQSANAGLPKDNKSGNRIKSIFGGDNSSIVGGINAEKYLYKTPDGTTVNLLEPGAYEKSSLTANDLAQYFKNTVKLKDRNAIKTAMMAIPGSTEANVDKALDMLFKSGPEYDNYLSNKAKSAAEEVKTEGGKASGSSGLQDEESRKRYETALKAADSLFKGNVDDAYVENLPHFIWDEYGYLKKAYENKGYIEKDAKKQAAKQTGYFLLQNLGTALANMSHIIKGDGTQEKSDYEKVQESRLQGAMERYNKRLDEGMQKDIDAVKSILGNEVNVENSIKQIYTNASVRNAYAKLDAAHKAMVINEMIKLGDEVGWDKVRELIKTSFIDMASNGDLGNTIVGTVKDAGGALIGGAVGAMGK